MNWHKVALTFWVRSSYLCQRLVFHGLSFLQLDGPDRLKFLREKYSDLRNRIPVWKGRILSRLGRQADGVVNNSLLLAKVWRTNDKASWNYVPAPFPGKVTDFRPMKQYRIYRRPDLKWDHLAQSGQETIVLPLYPATMLVEPFVKDLAAALRQAIDLGQQQAAEKH